MIIDLILDAMEDNKEIAKFHGKEEQGQYFVMNDWYYEDSLKYHESYNWLMSVVEAIEAKGAKVTIGRMFCSITYQHPLDKDNSFETDMVSGVKINSIHAAVVEFAKWHNSKKS